LRISWFALPVAALTISGCSDWPRFANIEQDDGLVAAGSDPRELAAEPNWVASLVEDTDNDLPTTVSTEHPLALGEGGIVSGNLDGLGWHDTRLAEEITDSDCSGETGSRSPREAGDYIGDVDFYLLDVTEKGTLCASGQFTTADHGWDMLLFELVDGCKVPMGPTMQPEWQEGILGFGHGGALVEWGHVVEPGNYAVMVAGYFPNEQDVSLDYHLALSLSAAGPEDSPLPCPIPANGGDE